MRRVWSGKEHDLVKGRGLVRRVWSGKEHDLVKERGLVRSTIW